MKNMSRRKIFLWGMTMFLGLIAMVLMVQIIYEDNIYAKYEDELKETYGINVSKDNCSDEAKMDYELVFSQNQELINENLEVISNCIKQLPEGLISDIGAEAYISLKDGKYSYTLNALEAAEGYSTPAYPEKNIHLVLCESVYRGEDECGGYTAYGEEETFIVLALGSEKTIEENFYHEFFHALEMKSAYTVYVGKFTAFLGWQEYNPENYEYSKGDANEYILGTAESVEDVYFISEYATKNQKEDKADLFAYMMVMDNQEEFEKLMEYPHIKAKVQFMSDIIMEAFPSMTEDNCFQWQRWLMQK